MQNLAWILFAFLLCGACTKKMTYKSEHPKLFVADELPADIRVPLKMWEFFGEDNDEFIFSEVDVWLKQKNDDVLIDDSIKIQFPKGGGSLDISNFVGKNSGTFFVGFDFPEFEGATMKKVLFISRAKKRRIESEVWGSGCNKIIDVTSQFMKAMDKDGIKVNTSRNRHLSVLGGTFILAATKDGQNFITQVTIKDPHFSDLFCSEAP